MRASYKSSILPVVCGAWLGVWSSACSPGNFWAESADTSEGGDPTTQPPSLDDPLGPDGKPDSGDEGEPPGTVGEGAGEGEGEGGVALDGWHRVGHRPVQVPAISDGPASPHSYFSVVAFDSGEVLPLNDWYHPQLFEYVPETSALVSRAFLFPHQGLGNEDDIRWRIRAHKGASAAESLVFWHVMTWEEITDENGTFGMDAAVFSTRPIEESPGVMPLRQARVINMGADADEVGVGPYRAGIDYDPVNHIVFVSTDRSDRSEGHSLFHAFSVDLATGAFDGRAIVGAPGPTYLHEQTFIRADPAHGLVLTQGEDAWERDRPILHLATYAPAAGDAVATFGDVQQLEASALAGAAVGTMPVEARDAVFAEQDGRVWAVVAARGLYVFDLGPVGGPYTLGPPVGRVPLTFRAEAIQRIDDELVVSSHGLEVRPLSSVLAVRGEQVVEAEIYRLPYRTYELDVATIGGRQTIFLASGPEGLDVFERGAGQDAGALARDPARPVTLTGADAEIVLETGNGLRTMGAPVLNEAGDMAFWAVTEAGSEAIVLLTGDEAPRIVADTGRDPYVALGRPSLASEGRVAFWAAHADGSQSIVEWNGALGELAHTDAGTIAFDQPELSDGGAVLFAQSDGADASSLVLRAADGALATVFGDDGSWLYPAEDGAPAGQYDVSPSGEAVFVKRVDRRLVLSWWDGARAVDVASDDREVNFPRMVASGVAAYRSWGSEIIRLRVVRARPEGGPGTPEIVADRHTLYGSYRFGNFPSAAALECGDAIFVAPKWGQAAVEPAALGNTLHRFHDTSDSLPGTLVATADEVDGATVRNVLFLDAATAGHTIAFVLELERADGAVTYALTRIPEL